MNKNFIYGLGFLMMMIGTSLNTIKLNQGFILWWFSNSIFLFKAINESDRWMKLAWSFLLFSSIFGYGFWIINT